MTALQYSEYYLVTTIYPGFSGVTYKDHKKWKITGNQAFSVIFILSETPEIGKI